MVYLLRKLPFPWSMVDCFFISNILLFFACSQFLKLKNFQLIVLRWFYRVSKSLYKLCTDFVQTWEFFLIRDIKTQLKTDHLLFYNKMHTNYVMATLALLLFAQYMKHSPVSSTPKWIAGKTKYKRRRHFSCSGIIFASKDSYFWCSLPLTS